MTIKTVSSREFNQNVSKAKKDAEQGPVVITTRGKPAHVLLNISEYQELINGQLKIADLLALPGAEDIELEMPKLNDQAQAADLF